MRKILVAILFLTSWTALRSQIDVSAELDSARIMIGDQTVLTLRIAHPPDVKISRVDWSPLQLQKGIEVLSTGRLDTVASNGDMLLQQKLRLTSFDSGYHRIPPIPVHYTGRQGSGTLSTNALGLQVFTFPIHSDTATLAPIKVIIEEPLRLQDVLPYIFLLLGVIALTLGIRYWIYRRNAAGRPPAPAVKRPAHEVALEQLRALKAAKLWQQGRIKDFHSELTHIVRQYLENRYRIPALESTTDEIVEQLRRQTDLEGSWRSRLRDMLSTADMVKFAKANPPLSVHEEMLERAGLFVEATREAEAPEEEKDEKEKAAEMG